VKTVVVSGSFDDLRPRRMRFLHEASRPGSLHVLLWSDEVARAQEKTKPKFPEEERLYFIRAVRYVSRVILVHDPVAPDGLPSVEGLNPDVWVVEDGEHNAGKQNFSQSYASHCAKHLSFALPGLLRSCAKNPGLADSPGAILYRASGARYSIQSANGKCLAPGDHRPHLQDSKDSKNLKKLWPPAFQTCNRISRKSG